MSEKEKLKMNRATPLGRNKDVILRKEKTGGLLFNPATGDFAVLNKTGCFVWEQIDGNKSEKAIISGVLKIYDVEEKTARNDVKNYLDELKKSGFILPVSSSRLPQTP